MAASHIVIKGAREHNLQDVGLALPRNRLICFTGVSGSGKSSLAFDTLFAEGQRRYVESLSSFARHFLGQMPKPDVDLIAGISPSISISQKSGGQSPRSTVGTITEIYDYLRVLYARVGKGHCPQCGRPITAQTRQQILASIDTLPPGTRFLVLAPLVRGQKGEYRDLFEDLLKQGFVRARVDGSLVRLTDQLRLDRQMRHNIEVVVDRLVAGPASNARLAEAVELALRLGDGNLVIAQEGPDSRSEVGTRRSEVGTRRVSPQPPRSDVRLPTSDLHLSAHYACTHCRLSFEPPSPQMFSFNSPQGMCPKCNGLGEIYTFDPQRLIPDPGKSFQQGCIVLVGRWRQLGRWRRHIFRGVADTLERTYGLEHGTVLETAWEELDPMLRDKLLWGTGDLHVTYTWRAGRSGHKWGGTFEGIIPKLLSQYRNTRSRMQRRALEKYMRVVGCAACGGGRLNPQASAVTLTTASPKFSDRPERTLPEVCSLPVSDAAEFFGRLELDDTAQKIAAEAMKEIRGRFEFLKNVGLDYLTLDRTAPTLAGGEMQRIRLAGQIGCGLVGVLYILDEPSIGLHHRDNDRLLETLANLRDQGNTVIIVEHDEDTMRAADHLVDFGPGPGVRGGRVVAAGPVERVISQPKSITGDYLSGRRRIEVPTQRRAANHKRLVVRGAEHNNLHKIDVEIPLGVFVCVTGVSGSGKSSLVGDILVEALRRDLNGGMGTPGAHQRIEGLEHLDKMIAIDQSPIGRTPRSNPATYIKVFDDVRNLYAQLPESKARGYKPGRFSFNVADGRCGACDGNGSNKLEMDFLADIWVTCPVCEGRRFDRQTLQVRYKGKSIAQVLQMDVQEALEHFQNVPKIRHKLQTLHDVGLDYMKLGQPSPTLSGGEAQRVKLARELVKKSTGQTLYVLDEPTTGLHFADIQLLLEVLDGFVAAGNTVLVVEHNLEVVKRADWIIDLGPEGGDRGGRIVAAGTPEQIAQCAGSHTGKALRPVLNRGDGPPTHGRNGRRTQANQVAAKRERRARSAKSIKVRGAREHNLKSVDVEIPREQVTVCCGPSGSGKTSLAMDTIYAEGQRRYVESLSAYARQFVGQMQKPKLDHIEGLSPAIAIEQKHTGHTPRSTVGTVTEIYDYLRVLMARLGEPHCPHCGATIGTQSADEVIAKVLDRPSGTRLYLMAPLEIHVGERYEALWDEVRASGYVRIRVDGQTYSVDNPPQIDRRRRHDVEVVIDRVVVGRDTRSRIADSVENALALGRGVLSVAAPQPDVPEPEWPVEVHSQHFACDSCGRSFEPLSPHNFSFNSSLGWCPACEGLGLQLGANPAALLHDRQLTLAQGAVAIWPDVDGRIFPLMLDALARRTGIPTDVPFDQLGARHRRLVMHGTGDLWFDVSPPLPLGEGRGEGKSSNTVVAGLPSEPLAQPEVSGMEGDLRSAERRGRETRAEQGNDLPASEGDSPIFAARKSGQSPSSPPAATDRHLFRFQYKGLYPALEEASRVSPALRGRLQHMVDEVECSVCGGSRLRDEAAAVELRGRTIDEICRQPLGGLVEWFNSWKLSHREQEIAGEVVREIRDRLQFLVDVGLEYLTLGRPGPSLSGGEMQRIRLAAQVGSGLCGVLYVLDEPTIGLHARDNRRLLDALGKLRDLGNTLLVVEHDRQVVQSADRLLDFGPGAGRDGGRIVARGTPKQIATRRASVTGPYLSGKKAIPVPVNRRMPPAGDQGPVVSGQGPGDRGQGSGFRVQGSGVRVQALGRGDEAGQLEGEGKRDASRSPVPLAGEGSGVRAAKNGAVGRSRRKGAASPAKSPHPNPLPQAGEGTLPPGGGWLEVIGARHNNLKNIDVRIPLGTLTVVTGTSGSGKSSLVDDVLYNALARTLHHARAFPGAHDEIRGLEQVNKVIRVDQRPLGQTPTSNPATFTGVFDLIRSLFAQLPESKLRGYSSRRFSFNVPGGRCEKCEGNGQLKIEMHFLPDVWVECDACRGRRYQPETLAVRYHGRSIADVLDMPCSQAAKLFENIPKIRRILQTLCDVGLDYLTLGQPAPTLSGGEAQRVKLAAELSRPDTGRTLYLLDEPTTGLHFDDLGKLLDVLNRLVDLGNTVVVIEHNLDVVKTADWVIDLGPEGGNEGGYLVVAGTPEDVVQHARRWKTSGEWRGERGELTGKRKAESGKRLRDRRLSAFRSRLFASSHRSYTGEALDPVLAAGPLVERRPHDFAAEEQPREGDLDIADVGRDARMPWEIDGPRWHTKDRVGRTGNPCRWDGRILARVVDRIEQSGEFSPTDWSARTVVEIRAAKKSDGWFFHAITGEEWLLKMKFRTAKRTFRREELVDRLDLKALNDMPELPLYGTAPRVKCRSIRGPWQEVEVRVHSYEEVDRPEFWRFIDRAIAGFRRFADMARKRPDDLMPWKALGRKWHFIRRGFLKGGPPRWEPAVLEEVCRLLEEAAPGCGFEWTNKVTVPVDVNDGKTRWAVVGTKKPDAVHLALIGPKNRFPLGGLTGLGHDPQLDARSPDFDAILLKFRSAADLARGDLPGFLKEHLAALDRR